MLRDVLAFSAAETAQILETTVPSVTSALARARGSVRTTLPPRSQHCYAQRQDARVKANAVEWLTNSAKGIWPRWDWSLLVGSDAVGPARFDSQYWLATLNPSDRYVLALRERCPRQQQAQPGRSRQQSREAARGAQARMQEDPGGGSAAKSREQEGERGGDEFGPQT